MPRYIPVLMSIARQQVFRRYITCKTILLSIYDLGMENVTTEINNTRGSEGSPKDIIFINRKGTKDGISHMRSHAHTHIPFLQLKHLICISFVWFSPLIFILNTIKLTVRFGLPPVLISYFVVNLVLCVPMIMIYLFLGSYARKGYIALWEMVPALKGFSWSASLFSITVELFNISISGIALLYITKLFSNKIPWVNCNFTGATSSCVPMNATTQFTNDCCFYGDNSCHTKENNNYIYFPAVEYFYYNILNIPNDKDKSKLDKIQIPMVLAVGFIWILIFSLMILGFQKFINFFTLIFTILMYFYVIITIFLLFLTVRIDKLASPEISKTKLDSLASLQFWTEIVCHSAFNIIPSNFIVLGAMSPQKLVPTLQSFRIFVMQFMFMIIFTIWLSITTQVLQDYYNVTHIQCIKFDRGFLFIFALMPDLLTRSLLPHLVLFVWFFSIWMLGFASSLFTMTAFLESLVEASPKIFKVRIYFSAIFCMVLFAINVVLLTNSFLITFETWTLIVFRHIPLTLIMIFSFGLLFYSIKRINNDYCFTYGKSLRLFWTESYKLILVVTFFVIFGFISLPLEDQLDPNAKQFFPHIYIIVILLPILIVAIVIYMIYKNKNEVQTAVIPTTNWGPQNYAKKQARLRFNPEKIIYLTDLESPCSHSCLLNSITFKTEMKLKNFECFNLLQIYSEKNPDEIN